jgi:hypothetical protein
MAYLNEYLVIKGDCNTIRLYLAIEIHGNIIRFVSSKSKENLKSLSEDKEESNESDYEEDEDQDQLEAQVEETVEITTNQVF